MHVYRFNCQMQAETTQEWQLLQLICPLLGIDFPGRLSREEMDSLFVYLMILGLLEGVTGDKFESIVNGTASFRTASPRYFHLFSLRDASYKGNALHHLAREPCAIKSKCLVYAVAWLSYCGCDLYNQMDSDGHAACYLLALAKGSEDFFYPRKLLYNWCMRRNEPDYIPCEATRALLVEE